LNKLHFLIFFLIAFSIYSGIHYYVYSQLSCGLSLSASARAWLKIFIIVAAVSFITGEIASRQSGSFAVKSLTWFGIIWFGVMGIALSTFLIRNISLIFFHSPEFKYYSTIISIIVIGAVTIYSYINQAQEPKIKQIEIKSSKIPLEMSGFSIVQLSDLHLGHLKSVKSIKAIVDRTNSLNPDLIVISGDLIDSPAPEFNDTLRSLKAKYGVFIVTGNHDYYAGLDNFLETANNTNMTILRNEKATVADTIELVGINDIQSSMFENKKSDLKMLIEGCDLKKFVVLLSHQPQVFDEAAKLGVDLQLSGHTHAGQVPPMDLLVKFYYKYPAGLYKKGASYIYTNPGTSYWGPPLRTFTKSEIVKITLSN